MKKFPLYCTVVCVAFFIIMSLSCKAQTIFKIDTSIHVAENGNILTKAWAGGLNCPMYSSIDLNHDGIKDLFIFDHKTGRILTFINTNQANTVSYIYAPEYEKSFPRLHDWAVLYDFSCDGLEDILTYSDFGGYVAAYVNTGQSPLQFQLVTNQMKSTYNFGFPFTTNIYANSASIPAFTDLDNDGDMDVLNLANGANYIEYQKNYSMDSTGNCGGFLFYNIRRCWGYFIFGGLSNKAVLPPGTLASDCPPYPATAPRPGGTNTNSILHGGIGFLNAVDMEGDGDKDLLLSSDYGTNVLYIENGGNKDSAYAISQDTLFPSYDTGAIMQTMPATSILDVNNDGKKDLLVSNFDIGGGGEDYYHTLYYENVASAANDHHFQFMNNTFFSEEMIDVGTGAHPAFFDVDGDGKNDLLVASDYRYYNANKKISQISYYRNTGTSANPSYNLITNDYAGLAAYNFLGLYPTFGDIDGDGDKDMILGNNDASLTYFKNIGGAGPANFVLDSLHYQNISVGSIGQQSTPQLVDLDHDGLLDLVIGRRSGTLYYYHNTGTATNPIFSFVTNNLGGVNVFDPMQIVGYSVPLFFDSAGTTQLLVGSYTGTLYHYTNIDGNLGGQFTLTDSAYMGIYEPTNAAPAMADLNADGLYDLVIGNLAGGLRCYKQSNIVGVNENASPDPMFNFFPNPVNDYLSIAFNDAVINGNREINIYNVLGKKVFHQNSKLKLQAISMESIPPGSYIISVIHNGSMFSQKFIKK